MAAKASDPAVCSAHSTRRAENGVGNAVPGVELRAEWVVENIRSAAESAQSALADGGPLSAEQYAALGLDCVAKTLVKEVLRD